MCTHICPLKPDSLEFCAVVSEAVWHGGSERKTDSVDLNSVVGLFSHHGFEGAAKGDRCSRADVTPGASEDGRSDN